MHASTKVPGTRNTLKSATPRRNPFTRYRRVRRTNSAVSAITNFLVNLVAIIAIVLAGFVAIDTARAAQADANNTSAAQADANNTSATQAEVAVSEAALQLATALVRPNDMNTGGLLLPSEREGFFVQAPRLNTNVTIDVTGPIARTTVIQRFENVSAGWVEGVYVFPLPEDSAVDKLIMRIGDRVIEGQVKPRAKAREIYEQAKAEGKKAALLEQQRPNIFTNAVANIGPGETVVVRIEYQQTVKQDMGEFSLRFPMVVAPRYNPQPVIQMVDFSNNRNGANKSGWGTVDPVPDRARITPPVLDPRENAKINPVTLKVNLAAGFPLDKVKSHHHTMREINLDEATRTLVLRNETVPADQDFELTWTAKGTAPNAALFKQSRAEADYLLAFVTPPRLKPADLPEQNRESIFVIDNSGSMAGESIVQAKQALAEALADLKPTDTFNIVRFDDTMETLFRSAVPADRENIGTAVNFVNSLQAEGGTEMLPALKAALVDATPGDANRIRQVIFITDGAIGNEQQLFDEIGNSRGRSRVFTIGIGSAPNSYFMNRAAEIGRGTFTHIGSTDQVQSRMASLFEKLKNPVMVNLAASVSGAKGAEISPDPLPDLYLGEPIVVSGRLPAGADLDTASLTITGDLAGQPWQVSMNLKDAAIGEGVGKLWARRKIASLEASRSYGANPDAIDRQIEQTAMNHHLVSRLTSLVAVDVTPSRPAGEKLDTTDMPVNLPKGWEYEKVFGEPAIPAQDASHQGVPLQTRAMVKTGQQVAKLVAAAPSAQVAADIAKARRAVTLPQTATPAEQRMLLGLLLMVLAIMLAATARVWAGASRTVASGSKTQLRRDYERLP